MFAKSMTKNGRWRDTHPAPGNIGVLALFHAAHTPGRSGNMFKRNEVQLDVLIEGMLWASVETSESLGPCRSIKVNRLTSESGRNGDKYCSQDIDVFYRRLGGCSGEQPR